CFFFSSRRRHTRWPRDWSSDVCSSDLTQLDSKAVTESPSRDSSLDIFSDNRIFRAPLPGIAAGSIVEELITWKDRNPLFDTGTRSEERRVGKGCRSQMWP